MFRLFRRKRTDPVPSGPSEWTAPIAPEAPFFAIGDVHGCYEKLAALVEQIDALDPQATIICVGDYSDRGERSADVLRHLHALSAERGERFVCLAGNHEDMLLGFLHDPEGNGPLWLRNGGLQTLASFGLGLPSRGRYGESAAALADAMGPELLHWMKALPDRWQSGNVAVTHAGGDPRLPLSEQDRDTLLWGHPAFRQHLRADGIWMVHGHVIHPEPVAELGRIAVDTGAFATGRLTAAHVVPGGVTFLQA